MPIFKEQLISIIQNLKHKAYEDIDTIITMPSIQPKKMLCQVAELELDTINGQKSTLLLFSTHMT